MTFKLNDATFIIYPPLQEEYELSNDYSLITSFHMETIASYLQEMLKVFA